MALVDGIRVVRGPDWTGGEEDGGEGHVGTVTDNNEDNTVEVQWDMGQTGTYKTGSEGKCELRILDSAAAGLKHQGETCGGCKESDFPGTLWRCKTCPSVSLCTLCYFKDQHELQHEFNRVDVPGWSGMPVKKRSISNKMRALGIFKGAKVKRGADWNSGNQDGGDGKVGTITDVVNYGTTGPWRDAVKVKWLSGDSNQYRLGYRGKVDLECVEETPGLDYYRDHLMPMNTTPVTRTSTTAKPAMKPKPSIRRQASTMTRAQVGDKVCVELPEAALKEMQKGHGGWSMRMKDYIGQHGVVRKFEENGDCVIDYDDKQWRFNPEALRKVPSLKVGDIVRIIPEVEKAEALQKKHGGWTSEMTEVLGAVGKIVKIDSDGDVAVAFGSKAFVFNPACCEAAPGQTVSEFSGGSGGGGAGGGERRAGGAGAGGGGGGASGGSGGGGGGKTGDDDDDDTRDEAAEALANLIAQLFLVRPQTAAGAQHLVAAAANNDVASLIKLLKAQPKLINEKHKGLTALIISAHEGHKGVVDILIKCKADLNLREEKGNTALMAALMKKREEVSMMLIEAGADIRMWNANGRTALHFAASNGANSVLRELLNRKADPNRQDAAGDTPLHDAIHNKNNSAVPFLVAAPDANLKLLNAKGHIALHLAAMKDDEMAVERILTKAPELKNARKSTDGYTALHIAAINDNTAVIKTLVRMKCDVDARNINKYTPLHLSCHQGHLEASQVLIEASANVNVQDDDGDTPLHNCVMGRRQGEETEQLARLLFGMRITRDAEVQQRTNLGCLLIKAGANVSIMNKKGRTALQSCSDERMRNALTSYANKHARSSGGGGASGGGRPQTAMDLLAQLFTDLPLPCGGCREKVADAKFAPCGHRVLCKQCAFRVRDCPRCHVPILERYDMEGNRLVAMDSCKVQ
ncbi:E3 ubiquitin-protein ligase MIB2-like isoform X2 [Mya arenaria]|uniref:E3 ubiquitin-protein ligase MIB2-like isoform X2 n=1 Tax=Mya arenaria TaxID=6604 RepID=UPI0022E50C8E|nr:E3 ubiquitin-protein ligase MIB2-like isoform X2 [Mya arenaria]